MICITYLQKYKPIDKLFLYTVHKNRIILIAQKFCKKLKDSLFSQRQ